MEIKELNKKQLVLLTLFITFVVSIATGIVTVSLMQQAPESVPQTVNNVIQRTIEKVTTVQVPVPVVDQNRDNKNDVKESPLSIGDGNVLIPLYLRESIVGNEKNQSNQDFLTEDDSLKLEGNNSNSVSPSPIGQGVLISDMGLVLVDSNILVSNEKYKVVLNKMEFDVSVLKKFNNNFTILKINQKEKLEEITEENNSNSEDKTSKNIDN